MENLDEERVSTQISAVDFYQKIYSCVDSKDGPVAVVPIQILFQRYRRLCAGESTTLSFGEFCEFLELLQRNHIIEYYYEPIEHDTDLTNFGILFNNEEVLEH